MHLSPRSISFSLLRAAAHRAAVETLVASAAADHDRAAIGTGRRILLVKAGDAADARHRSAAARRLSIDRNYFFADRDVLVGLWLDDPHFLLRIAVEKLGGEPAENIIHDRLGHGDVGVFGEARRLETHMAELVDQTP